MRLAAVTRAKRNPGARSHEDRGWHVVVEPVVVDDCARVSDEPHGRRHLVLLERDQRTLGEGDGLGVCCAIGFRGLGGSRQNEVGGVVVALEEEGDAE